MKKADQLHVRVESHHSITEQLAILYLFQKNKIHIFICQIFSWTMKITVNEYEDENRETECSQMEVQRQFKLFF